MGVVTRVSEEEYLANPEWEKYEFLDGEVVEAYVGKLQHSMAQFNCALLLGAYLKQNPIGFGGTELGCRLTVAGRVFYYLPDVCVVLGQRPSNMDYLNRGPDLVVEVRSPGDSIVGIMRRMEHYFLNGSQLGWIVLPEDRSVLAVSKGLTVRTVAAGEALDGNDVLAGLRIALDELFA